MTGIVLMLIAGVLLSAFFSGTETGFYRVGRIRLALDAREGSRLAKIQLWFINNPAMFVATTLVGNNLANNLVSRAIVLMTQHMIGGSHWIAELASAIIFAPFIFIYGELLPKMMFYASPNWMLRRTGPFFLFFALLLAPVSGVLGLLGLLLKRMVGESHSRIRQRLARHELSSILDEGRDAGILGIAQRQLAQSVFNVADERVLRLTTSLERTASVRDSDRVQDVIAMAKRRHAAELVVLENSSKRVLGYVRVSDVLLAEQGWQEVRRPMMVIRSDESHLTALIKMRKSDAALADVVDAQGHTVGILHVDSLLEPLFTER